MIYSQIFYYLLSFRKKKSLENFENSKISVNNIISVETGVMSSILANSGDWMKSEN
jgi:hypothetical protein